ncbi:MAG: winged helix-turn-helix domain-containing protein [Acidobacteriia bacterium]|nr:winged helix-turn-helix domain-containing protein [Terriglobia bacterium]
MPENPNTARIFRFGLYEFDGLTGELRKDGKARPRLQGQPLEVLLHLLDRPGELVTREELRQRLWPSDTFVDYDHSLNTAVNKLREALSDSADNPRFIQTIPRRGYRFIASIEVMNAAATNAAPIPETSPEIREPGTALPIPNEARSVVLSDPEDLPPASHRVVRILFSLIQVMYLSFYVISLANLRQWEPWVSQEVPHAKWLFVVVVVTALVGIPVRLYLLSAAAFRYRGLTRRFLKLFPALFPLDELWALAPFLLLDQISTGLALAVTAALLYVPFSQRSLLLMGDGNSKQS